MAAERGESALETLLNRILGTDRLAGIFLDCQALAAAGSVISDAGAITCLSFGLVTVSAADDTKGVRLPTPTQAGTIIFIKSTVANKILKVWPHSAAVQINALTAAAAISLASGPTIACFVWDGTTWYTLPLLPS